MAQFLPKEHFNVQAPLANQGGSDLAGDLLKVLGSVGKMKQDSMALMAKESEEIGNRVAIDKLLQYNELIKEEEELKIKMRNKHDFNSSISRIDEYVGLTIADVKDKFGEDSKAYKAFERDFVYRATKLQQEKNLSFFSESIKVANENERESVTNTINNGFEAFDAELLDKEVQRFISADGDQMRISKYVVGTALAKAQNNNIDFRHAFDEKGNLNQDALARIVEQNFGSVVTLNKDGSIEKKHEWLEEDDVASIKRFIDTNVDALKSKSKFNESFFVAKKTVEEVKKRVSFGSSSEVEEWYDSAGELLMEKYSLAPHNQEDRKYMLGFETEKKAMVAEYRAIESIIYAGDDVVGGAYRSGNYNGISVNKETIERVYQKNYDVLLAQTFPQKEDGTPQIIDEPTFTANIRSIMEKENTTGIRSSVLTQKVVELQDFSTIKNIEDARFRVSTLERLFALDYTMPNVSDKVSMFDIEAIKEAVKTMEVSGTVDANIINQEITYKLINANVKKNKSSESINKNIKVLTNLFSNDNNVQSVLTGLLHGITTTNVDFLEGFEGYGNMISVLAEQMAYSNISLDPLSPWDSKANKEIIERMMASRFDTIGWFGEIKGIMLPDTYDANSKTRRVLDKQSFIDGIVEIGKSRLGSNYSAKKIFENVRISYQYDVHNGITTSIAFAVDGVLGESVNYTGSEIHEFSLGKEKIDIEIKGTKWDKSLMGL